MAPDAPALPNVVVVVLDCGRADVFAAEVAKPDSMPFAHRLRDEVLSFSGAVAPSTWTIPSHASLFTGLYPWDHGAHNKGDVVLGPRPETIGERLHRMGYATASFSANWRIQPATGLARGFDVALWGGNREFYFRFLPNQQPSCPRMGESGDGSSSEKAYDLRRVRFAHQVEDVISDLPWAWDALNRVGQRVVRAGDPGFPSICPWIEGELRAWLERQPPERAVFSFINLMETHNPYFAGGGYGVGLRRWLTFSRVGQSSHRWRDGKWVPSRGEMTAGLGAYRGTFRTVDDRLRGIVEVLRRAGRWDNTLFVLTGDHGQSFLEPEVLYHTFRPDEPVLRVPLWIRSPNGRDRGVRSEGWVSLVDVPRTISEAVGAGPFGDAEARPLLGPEGGREDRAVFALTDGLPVPMVGLVPPSRRAFLDRVEVVAYQGDRKVVAAGEHDVRPFRVLTSDPTVAEAIPASEGGTGPLARVVQTKVREFLARVAQPAPLAGTEARLASWGY